MSILFPIQLFYQIWEPFYHVYYGNGIVDYKMTKHNKQFSHISKDHKKFISQSDFIRFRYAVISTQSQLSLKGRYGIISAIALKRRTSFTTYGSQ